MSIQKSIHVFLFYALLYVNMREAISISEIDGCPVTSIVLDYCNSEFNSCINRKSTFEYCIGQFVDCSDVKPLPVSEEKCVIHIQDVHRILNRTRQQMEKQKTIIELPDEIKIIVNEIDENCKLDIANSISSDLNALRKISSLDECGMKYKPKLDDGLIELDRKTSTNFPIPFSRSRCGWQYGYIGIVLWRHWIKNECESHQANINHICAEHLNCYMRQDEKESCDTHFNSSLKEIISTMTSYRLSCGSLSEKMFNGFEEKDYQIFKVSKIQTEIETFTKSTNQGLQLSNIGNLNLTSIKVFRLSSESSVNSVIREKFNRNIYKFGWLNRVSIDSCAMIFEYGRESENLKNRFSKLQICIDNIEGKSEIFKDYIKEFNSIVSSQIENITKEDVFKKNESYKKLKKDVEKLMEVVAELKSEKSHVFWFYLQIIVDVLTSGYVLFKVWEWCSKKYRMYPPSLNNVPTEPNVRYNSPDERLVIEPSGSQ